MTHIKRGDARTLHWVLNADLTGATLRFLARADEGPLLEIPAQLEGVTAGQSTVAVAFTTAHTATARTLQCEIEATAGGQVLTFPSSGHAQVTILPDLG